jgi:hypothetical protein
MKAENFNNISPNSDVSNSSLNLNYSSLIINPMKLTFENSLIQKNEPNMTETAKVFIEHGIHQQQQQQQHHQQPQQQQEQQVFTDSSLPGPAAKTKEAKLLKKQQKINSTLEKKKKFPANKPTVAALLSAVYEQHPPKITTPEKVLDIPLVSAHLPLPNNNNDNSNNNIPIVNNDASIPDLSLLIGKSSKKLDEAKINALTYLPAVKKSTTLKTNNKLKDYFKSSDDSFFSNKSNNACNIKPLDPEASLLLTNKSSELSKSIGDGASVLAEISQQNNSQYHMLDEEFLFKKKSSKLNKKLNKELMLQEKKLKKKNKLLEALALKSLKQKRKKNLANEEEANQLVFEIVGDDGFYVQSKDINSKFFLFILFQLIYKN